MTLAVGVELVASTEIIENCLSVEIVEAIDACFEFGTW